VRHAATAADSTIGEHRAARNAEGEVVSEVLYNGEGRIPPNAYMIDRLRKYMTEKLYAVEVELLWTAFREPERLIVRCVVDAPTWLEAEKAAREAALSRCGGEQPTVNSQTTLVKAGEDWPFPVRGSEPTAKRFPISRKTRGR